MKRFLYAVAGGLRLVVLLSLLLPTTVFAQRGEEILGFTFGYYTWTRFMWI